MPVEVDHDGSVATIVLNRPGARNALSVEMCAGIVQAAGSVAAAPDVRVAVLRGAGKAFCAGADLEAVSKGSGGEFLVAFEGALEAVARLPVPTIACIHGAALGGGLQLATVCDLRVVAVDAALGIPSARLGIVVNLENVERLVVLAGVAVAKEVLMTGRTFTGAEAAVAGLVNRAVDPAALTADVAGLAAGIARRAPLSVRGAKAAIDAVARRLSDVRRADPAAAQRVDALVAQAYASEDLVEGVRALAERREPDFEGR